MPEYKMCANEEMAIYILEFIQRGYKKYYDDEGVRKYIEALQMSIDALEKQIPKKPETNYDRIRNMSVEEMANFLAHHIGNYEAPHEVKDIYRNAINEKTGKGIIWIDAFKLWLENDV